MKLIDFLFIIEQNREEMNVPQITSESGDKKVIRKIFISHASKDQKICKAFVDLLESLGLPENMILFSSSPRHGIPGDKDIFEYLRDHFTEETVVYYMLSDNYYDSIYCLNEMGAAWVTQSEFSTFILPNFTRKIEGVINSNIKAYKLSDAIELTQFKKKFADTFNLHVSDEKWEEIKNNFLEKVKSN